MIFLTITEGWPKKPDLCNIKNVDAMKIAIAQ